MTLPSALGLSGKRLVAAPRFVSHRAAFLERFGDSGPAPRVFFAPGRVNLMGAHLDYNGGPVMPMAIDRGTFVATRPRGDGKLRLVSSSEAGEASFDLDELVAGLPASAGEWWDYPLGVLGALEPRSDAGGLDLFFGGDLPVGAGLSSSASVTIATAVALDAHFDLGLDVQAAVDAALAAERGYVGVQCGIMDPYAVGHARPGHLLVLDCADRSSEHVALDATKYTVAVVDTGVRRELSRGEFNSRVEQCAEAYRILAPFAKGAANLSSVPLAVLEAEGGRLSPVVARRARHVLEETRRTLAARDALRAGDVAHFGQAMFAAHESLRVLFEVSIPELDLLVELAHGFEGVLGSRLTGAGFGGCVAAVLEVGKEQAFTETMQRGYAAQYGREPQVAFYRGSPGLGEVGF